MKLLLGLLVMLPIPTLFATGTENRSAFVKNHASFHLMACPDKTTAKVCLEVDFPKDRTDDIALLEYVDGEVTVLSGHLMKDTKQSIAVTIYEDHMEVCMLIHTKK
jgi:hypothetical protein